MVRSDGSREMRWTCMAVGIILAFIAEIASPWPQFILNKAGDIVTDAVVASDSVLPTLVKVSFVIIAYIIFPALGAGIGYFVGFIWERKVM